MNLLRLFVPDNWSPDQQPLNQWYWSTNTGLRGNRLDRGLPAGFKTQVFLPSAAVLMLDIDLPRKGRWREALPYSVEEHLLGDLASAHIVADTQNISPQTRVQVLDRHWLNQLLAYLKEQGVKPEEMYAQTALISNQPNEWTILMTAHGGCLVHERGYTQALDCTEGLTPPLMLVQLLRAQYKAQKLNHLRVIWEEVHPDQLASCSVAWSDALGVRCTMESDFKTQAMRPLSPQATNLLTGEFAVDSKTTWRALNRSLKLALILLGATVVLWIAGYSLQTWIWGNHIRQLKAQAEIELRRAFPETRSILDPQLQMQKALVDLRAQSGNYAPDELPALLGRLKALDEIDYAHLISLDYQNQNALLVWNCDSADQAETLLGRLKQLGLEGTLKADSNGQKVSLRLTKAAP